MRKGKEVKVLNSGWLINFKNGKKVILSEKMHKEYVQEIPEEEIESEEHWFSIDRCIEKNLDVDSIKLTHDEL